MGATPKKSRMCVAALTLALSGMAFILCITYELSVDNYPQRIAATITASGATEPFPLDGLVFVTHHKTGTSLVGCITGSIAKHLEMFCSHRLTPIYVNHNLTSSTMGYYLDVTRISADARFGHVHGPHIAMKTGDAPTETCFDSADVVRAADALQHSASLIPAIRQCPGPCPCTEGVTNCLTIGNCYSSQPLANLFLVHTIRNPLDVVVSAYAYHMKDPPVEPWLTELNMWSYAARMAMTGADYASLSALGVYDPQYQNLSYWQFLRRLPEKDGLLLEFMRSSQGMWKMARTYIRTSKLGPSRGAVIRYEDLHRDPLHALTPVMRVFDKFCFKKHQAEFEIDLLERCHTKSWSEVQRASHTHLGQDSADVKARRARLLMSHPYIRGHILRLQEILEYPGDGSTSTME